MQAADGEGEARKAKAEMEMEAEAAGAIGRRLMASLLGTDESQGKGIYCHD